MIYEDVLKNPDLYNFTVPTIGASQVLSPLLQRQFVGDDERISFSSQVKNIINQIRTCEIFPSFEKAGPRKHIFYEPEKTRVAIVTCGGLCPGLNDVIKGIVSVLNMEYKVSDVFGIRYGYKGLTRSSSFPPIALDVITVDKIHNQGGTILGSSRENQDPKEMVDELISLDINILFCIGGDGTLRGAMAIAKEIAERNLQISVIGIPKTIDNDINFVEKTFGFETAVQVATQVISSAHAEAEGAENGIGIVKLMGRDSGFIAATATLANSVVDFCLIPEACFSLKGSSGLIESLAIKIKEKKHAVVVVAEGAGQELFGEEYAKNNSSENVIKKDIGGLICEEIKDYFCKFNNSVSIKYIDPSYQIRSVPTVATDAVFCYQLAQHAVHAGMAGKTNILIGHWNNFFTHVPIELATGVRRKIDLDSALWRGVLSVTQQDNYLN